MTEKELIQALQRNKYPFGMWPDPECYGKEIGEAMQAKAKEIQGEKQDPPIFKAYLAQPHGWTGCHICTWADEAIYQLRRDYEPPEDKAEVVECDIRIVGERTLGFGDGKGVWQLPDVRRMPAFIGFRWEGILWGCLYKHKETGAVVERILASMLNEYDVIDMTEAVVCFRSKTNEN